MADEEKDSGGWMKELGKDLRLQFHERLSSPLIGSFAISWLIWNHRLITVLVSGMSVGDRFNFIDTILYRTPLIAWWKLFIGPLLCALVYIYAYPDITKFINRRWLRKQNELKAQRDEIERATLLTKEEAEEIRRWSNQRVRETEEENRRLHDELQSLKKGNGNGDNSKEPPRQANDPFERQRRDIERQKLESEEIETELKLREARDRRSKSYGAGPSDPLTNLSEGPKQLLKYIAERGGSVPRKEAIESFKNEKLVRTESFIDRAVELELVTVTVNDVMQPMLHLTVKGRKYVVDHKLL